MTEKLDQPVEEQFTVEDMANFRFEEIPDFPDDFNVDDMNKIWEEMNKRTTSHLSLRQRAIQGH